MLVEAGGAVEEAKDGAGTAAGLGKCGGAVRDGTLGEVEREEDDEDGEEASDGEDDGSGDEVEEEVDGDAVVARAISSALAEAAAALKASASASVACLSLRSTSSSNRLLMTSYNTFMMTGASGDRLAFSSRYMPAMDSTVSMCVDTLPFDRGHSTAIRAFSQSAKPPILLATLPLRVWMSVQRSLATRKISLPAMSRCGCLMGASEAGVRLETMVWPCAVGCTLPMIRTLSGMVTCTGD